MKTRFLILFASVSLVAVVLISSCQETPIEPLNREQAQTRMLNLLAPDQVDVFLETGGTEISFGTRIPFGGSYPDKGYATLLTRTESESDSQRAAVFIRANNTFSREPVLEKSLFLLNSSVSTTLAMIDSFGKSKVVRAADTFPDFTADTTAILRFMNLAYHLPSVTMRSADSTIMFERYNSLTFSRFTEVPAGNYDFLFIEDSSGFPVANLPNMELEVGEIYNVWFTWRRGVSTPGQERLIID